MSAAGPAHLDSRGCLTAAGVTALAAALPGQGPPDLATHVAACGRCQERLLTRSLGAAAGRERGAARPPSWGRTLAIAGAFLLLLVILLVTLTRLAGG